KMAILSISLPEMSVIQAIFDHPFKATEHMWLNRESLFVAGQEQVWAFDLTDPQRFSTTRLPRGAKSVRRRHVLHIASGAPSTRTDDYWTWSTISGGPGGIVIDRLKMPERAVEESYSFDMRVFDRFGSEEPWVVTAKGNLYPILSKLKPVKVNISGGLN